MDIIKSVIDIVKDVGPTVRKYVKYQINHNDYVSECKEMQEKLKERLEDVEAKLQTQLNQHGKKARNEIDAWLKEARQESAENVVEDMICKGGCFTYICSSTNLKGKTEELKRILKEGKEFTNSGVPLPVEKCIGRDDIQEQILEWLKGDKCTRIAVWGMGGVGKTTIMKQVHNQLLKEPKFNKVIWVKVSKDFDIIIQQKKKFDILKFQKRIASSLELKLEPEDHENETKLAGLISQRLGQGSFVLILDDVWEPFSLKDVGIPDLVGNNGCKLVLTTRLQNVACVMGCKVIPVNPLPPEEALALFLEKVGSVVLSDGRIKGDIEPILKQILQKCDGVPLAIVIVARTMRGKSDPRSWKWVISKLSKFESIVDSLRSSFEYLEPQCQECFVYCALYPEDYEIPKEELIEYWIEEGFIYEGETRDAMNCEGHVILEKLVDNCLLELVRNRYEEDCVSMHDLLREMALDIRPQFLVKAGIALEELPEEHEWREDLLKVSLMKNDITEIPSSMSSPKCPMLTTLLLSDNKILTIPEAFFEHMLGLKILDLSNNPKLCWLPSSVSKLENLTTLLLGNCESLRMLPSLSNLGGLKKLDLWGTSIEELPEGLNMLTNLKFLHIGGKFSEIPDGLLQNLSKLQHLEVDHSILFKGEQIGRLGKLEFFYGRFSMVQEMSVFFNSTGKFLNMYGLIIGSYEDYVAIFKDMKFKSIRCGHNWLPFHVRSLEIDSCKDVRSLNDISGFQDATNLRFVKVESCNGMEFVLSWPWLNPLQNLEELRLFGLDKLNAVFQEVGAIDKSAPLPVGTFYSLKEIHVYRCNKIKKLFLVRWLGYLQNLQTLYVGGCENMEEIIWSEYEAEEKVLEKVTLSKLQKLQLMHLPQLESIYSSSCTVLICDFIKSIKIDSCQKIESVFWSGFNPLPTLEYLGLYYLENLKSVFDEEALDLSRLLPRTISFSLKEIRIYGCHQLKKVFSSGWLFGCFRFLETIQVYNCEQMEELIFSSAYEEEKVTQPKLQRMVLKGLPALKSIYNSSNNVLNCDSIKSLH